jgi:hypothetical protein
MSERNGPTREECGVVRVMGNVGDAYVQGPSEGDCTYIAEATCDNPECFVSSAKLRWRPSDDNMAITTQDGACEVVPNGRNILRVNYTADTTKGRGSLRREG